MKSSLLYLSLFATEVMAAGSRQPPVLKPERFQNAIMQRGCTTLGGGCHGWTSEASWQARHQLSQAAAGRLVFMQMDLGHLFSTVTEYVKVVRGGQRAEAEVAFRAGIPPDTLIPEADFNAVHPPVVMNPVSPFPVIPARPQPR